MNTSKIALYDENEGVKTCLSPEETIKDMFDYTDKENGILYIPEWSDREIDTGRFYKCQMNQNSEDAEDLLQCFEKLYQDIKEIAKYYIDLEEGRGLDRLSDHLKDIYEKYIRDFQWNGGEKALVYNIKERLDFISDVKKIEDKLAHNIEVPEEDMKYYEDIKNVSVAKDEEELYERYIAAVQAEAKSRVGDSLVSTDLICRARRLCFLLSNNPPRLVLSGETCYFAQVLAIHKYCTAIETVDTVE